MREKIFKVADIVGEYAVYGLIFFIPISKAALAIFLGIGLFAFFIKKLLKPEFNFLKDASYVLLFIFIIFCTLSLLNSGQYLNKSLIALFFKWGRNILVLFVVKDALVNRRRIINALCVLLGISFFAGLDAFSQRFLGFEFFRMKSMISVYGQNAATSGFPHFNDFGSYLIFPLTLTLAILCSRKLKKTLEAGLGALGILLGAAILLTLSRGAWLGFTFALTLLLILSKRYKALLVILSLFALGALFMPGIKERIMLTSGGSIDSGRFGIWQGTWHMIKENPFLGKGIGTFMDYSARYLPGQGVSYAHNCYLQIWAETGIFSLLSFLAFLGLSLLNGLKAFRKKKDLLILGIVCALSGFLVHSFFDTQFYSLQLSYLFWAVLGLLAASSACDKTI